MRVLDVDDGDEVWSAPGGAGPLSIAVGRTSDLLAYQGNDGDVVVRSLVKHREVGRVPGLPRARRLDFVNGDRWLLAFPSAVRRIGFDVLVWRPDELIGVAQELIASGATDSVDRPGEERSKYASDSDETVR